MVSGQLTWSSVVGTGAEGGAAVHSGPDVAYIIIIGSACQGVCRQSGHLVVGTLM